MFGLGTISLNRRRTSPSPLRLDSAKVLTLALPSGL